MAGRGAWATLAAVAVGSLAGVPAAQGAVTVTPTVRIVDVEVTGGPGNDRIAIRCERDRLVVNGRPARNGRIRCDELTKLRVEGRRGDDTISIRDLQTLRQALEDGNILEATVRGGPGQDRVFIDTLSEGVAFLGPGDDRFTSPAGASGVGGPGDDRMFAQGGFFSGQLVGGRGADRLSAGRGLSFLIGGLGPDRIQSFRGQCFAFGAEGPDVILGGPGRDLLAGGTGRDLLRGQNGSDLLAGQAGRDRLIGGYAPDLLAGGKARDLLRGGPGRDSEWQRGVPRDLGPFEGSLLGVIFDAILSAGPAGEQSQEEEVGPRARRMFLALLERGHRQAR